MKFKSKVNEKLQQNLASRVVKYRRYVEQLEQLLDDNNIPIPHEVIAGKVEAPLESLKIASHDAVSSLVAKLRRHYEPFVVDVEYRNLSHWNMIPTKQIETVGNAVKSTLFGPGPKHKFHILKNLNGRFSPQKLTLLMGPPSSGKTSFLKALSGQLALGSSHLDGEILYNGVDLKDAAGKFLIGKVANYVDQKDEHPATLTVKEICDFAFRMSSGGRHHYQKTRGESDKEFFSEGESYRNDGC